MFNYICHVINACNCAPRVVFCFLSHSKTIFCVHTLHFDVSASILPQSWARWVGKWQLYMMHGHAVATPFKRDFHIFKFNRNSNKAFLIVCKKIFRNAVSRTVLQIYTMNDFTLKRSKIKRYYEITSLNNTSVYS